MSNLSASGPERIYLERADDPRDVVHRSVESLARGRVVVVPTETTYCLAASGLAHEAVARVRALRGAPAGRPVGRLAVRGPGEVGDWVADLAPDIQRMLARAWPGPLAVLLTGDLDAGLAPGLHPDVRAAVVAGRTLGLCCPAHPFLRHVRALTAGPLVLATAAPIGVGAPTTIHELPELPGVDLIIDDGPTEWAARPTLVHWQDQTPAVLREGPLDETAVRRLLATIILFVCTGNTCRSPMAEALFRAQLARRLGCGPDDLERAGFTVLSSGLHANRGAPAARHAAEVVRALGASLDRHASRPMTAELVRHADLILAMTQDHLDALLESWPEAQGRARLVDPAGGDVDDPIGAELDTYRRTAEQIERHLRHWLGTLDV